MTITGIKDAVQALLAGTDDFVSVLPHPPKEDTTFGGFPSVCHYYSDSDTSVATVMENKRILEYVVELYLKVPATKTATEEFAEAVGLIDTVMQLFDTSNDLNNACDFLHPTPGRLERVTTAEGDALIMTFTLFCESDVTFTNS